MRRMAITATLLAATACKKNKASAETEALPEFEDGTYIVSLDTWTEDACGFVNVPNNPGDEAAVVEFDLSYTRFDLVYRDLEIDLLCDLSGDKFSCDSVDVQTLNLSAYDRAATVTVTFGNDGVWDANDAFSGDAIYTYSCTGADCNRLDSTPFAGGTGFPCDRLSAFEATLDEAEDDADE